MDQKLYGGIEAGGSKFICAVGSSPVDIVERVQIATTSPEETLARVKQFFERYPTLGGIGLATFGPVNLDPKSSDYGKITTTPKPGWQNTSLLNALNSLNIPIVVETDVNGAALGEQKFGAGQGLSNIAYVTVGTGIGVGCIVNGRILQGVGHTEFGHMQIPRVKGDDRSGTCSFHTSCLEGFASGTALQERHGQPAETISAPEAWSFEAQYLAYGIVNVILATMPERIIIGGGVMQKAGLLKDIRENVLKTLNGYIALSNITEAIDDYIVPPQLGDDSGVVGAIALATQK